MFKIAGKYNCNCYIYVLEQLDTACMVDGNSVCLVYCVKSF